MSSVLFCHVFPDQDMVESYSITGCGKTNDGSVWSFYLGLDDLQKIVHCTISCLYQHPGTTSNAWLCFNKVIDYNEENVVLSYKMTEDGTWTEQSVGVEQVLTTMDDQVPSTFRAIERSS